MTIGSLLAQIPPAPPVAVPTPEPIIIAPTTLDALGPTLLGAVVTVFVTLLALNWTRAALNRGFNRARVDASTRILVQRMVSVVIVVIGLMVFLGVIGVQPATLLTVVGAVGLAFSLAMQDILKNFFSGIYLLLERPFRVGDIIRVKDQQGAVEHVGVRTTQLRTVDNIVVMVPNAVVFAEVVSNHTLSTAPPPPPPGTAPYVAYITPAATPVPPSFVPATAPTPPPAAPEPPRPAPPAGAA